MLRIKADGLSSTRYPLWLDYVLPIVIFGLMTALEGYAPKAFYVWLYLAKVCLVTVTLIICRASWRDITPRRQVIPAAILVGLMVCAQWVALDQLLGYPHLGTRTELNPFADIAEPAQRAVFLAARCYGLVLMVPLMEEIFWRSFLLRYLTDHNFLEVPQGSFSWAAFICVSAAFAVSHPEWLAAAVTACAYALLLWRTRSLFACIVAHAVSNFALAAYVLASGQWQYW